MQEWWNRQEWWVKMAIGFLTVGVLSLTIHAYVPHEWGLVTYGQLEVIIATRSANRDKQYAELKEYAAGVKLASDQQFQTVTRSLDEIQRGQDEGRLESARRSLIELRIKVKLDPSLETDPLVQGQIENLVGQITRLSAKLQ